MCATIALAFFTRISSPAFAASDGGFIDELDVSGSFTRRLAADGLSAHLSGKGPGLVFAMAEADEKAFEDEGLPKAFYFEHGRLAITRRVHHASSPSRVVAARDGRFYEYSGPSKNE